VEGLVGKPGVRREVATSPEVDVTLADGLLTVDERVRGVRVVVDVSTGSPGVVRLVVKVDVTPITAEELDDSTDVILSVALVNIVRDADDK